MNRIEFSVYSLRLLHQRADTSEYLITRTITSRLSLEYAGNILEENESMWVKHRRLMISQLLNLGSRDSLPRIPCNSTI
ncbi:hypothetical protein M758_9G020300 [Ceratodon purpureus]|nr:hypothetical protein M758_9G020300 [Ceratodon purpureus]